MFLFFSLLRYLDGRIFVINVLPQSQAEVDEVVLVGDVIDEINGSSLRNASSGQVRKGAPGSLAAFSILRSLEETGKIAVHCCYGNHVE